MRRVSSRSGVCGRGDAVDIAGAIRLKLRVQVREQLAAGGMELRQLLLELFDLCAEAPQLALVCLL